MTIFLGPVEVKSGIEAPKRIAALLWGPAACGKTTFAATAPGVKLWLSFGDQEHVSIMHRPDVMVANFSALTIDELFKHAQSENPFGLDQVLADETSIETVVCDSATAITYLALQHSIDSGVGAGKKGSFVPTLMEPGQAAYGGRNAIVLKVLTGLLRVTAKHGVHLIITAHEADPSTEKDGIVNYVSIMLGGQLVNNVTFRLSEIWYMSERHGERKLAIRPTRLRRPMKTRMFSSKGDPEFMLKYDAALPDDHKEQMTIAKWYDAWSESGTKVPVPKTEKKDDTKGKR